MAQRRVAGSGRLRLAVLLVIFLAISGGVILRRVYGHKAQRELDALDARHAGLIAARLRLESDIRSASSRTHLQPIAEQRLLMRVPDAGQIITIPRVAP